MALTSNFLSDDLDKLTKPRQKKGEEYAKVETSTATDATPRGKGGVDVEGLVTQSRQAAEAEKRLDEIAKQEAAAKKGASAAKERAMAQRVGEIRSQYEPELQKPAPEFAPSKETVANLGSLGGMLMVLGAMSGSKGMLGATGAMNAMAGMLKGYQDGRKELFDREKATFEQNMKVWQANRQVIKETFDRAIKYAPYDIQKATNDAVNRLNSVGATTLAASVKKNGLQQTAATVQQADAQFNQVAMPIVNQLTAARFPLGVTTTAPAPAAPQQPMTKEQAQAVKEQFDQAQAEAKLRKDFAETARTPTQRISSDPQFVVVEGVNNGKPMRLTKEERDQYAKEGKNVEYVASPAAAARTTKQGQNALTFASRVYGNLENAAQDLQNIATLPATATTPLLSGLIGGDPANVFTALTAAAGRSITDVEARAFDQLSQQLGAALARIEAQGLASGSTNKTVATFDALRPKAGDDAINMALYLAKVKQEIVTGIRVHEEMPGATEGQKKKAQRLIKDMDDVVAFDVNDVIKVLRSTNKTLSENSRNLLSLPPIAPNLQFTEGDTSLRAAPNTQAPAAAPAAPAPASTISPQDQQALQWVQSNPNDPRAEGIKARLRNKGIQVP
jgi:hypothetical protein